MTNVLTNGKRVKTKFKKNTNTESVSPKNVSPLNLQNWFDNLTITEINQIEVHEWSYNNQSPKALWNYAY